MNFNITPYNESAIQAYEQLIKPVKGGEDKNAELENFQSTFSELAGLAGRSLHSKSIADVNKADLEILCGWIDRAATLLTKSNELKTYSFKAHEWNAHYFLDLAGQMVLQKVSGIMGSIQASRKPAAAEKQQQLKSSGYLQTLEQK